jgi:hypothetical protein
MADFRLSLTQRNELFEIAKKRDLDPTTFEWGDVTKSYVITSEILHPSTGAFVRMIHAFKSGGGGYFTYDYWPRTVDLGWSETEWNSIRARLAMWFGAVKAESTAPDLWREAKNQRAWLKATPADFKANTPFTSSEQEQIVKSLRTIEEFAVKTYHLQEAHQAHLHLQMEYLVDAADRVGRFDWKNLAASTFIEVVVTLGLDVEKTQKLLTLATTLLGPLVAKVAGLLSS